MLFELVLKLTTMKRKTDSTISNQSKRDDHNPESEQANTASASATDPAKPKGNFDDYYFDSYAHIVRVVIIQ